MRRGAVLVAGAALVAIGWAGLAGAQSHPAVNRPEIREVGDPILISRRTLAAEMTRNSDLRDWVRLMDRPTTPRSRSSKIDPPFAPYEVRLYYVKGNAYLAFGRVHVAPSLYDYGVRKYIGKIDPAELDRLLTAAPAVDEATAPAAYPETAPPWIIETTAVEGQPLSE